MKNIIVVLFLGFINHMALAQTYEIGVFLGGTNTIGDVGATNYINPNEFAFGGVFKWNKSTRHSYRASVKYFNLSNNDADSSDPRRIERNYSFDTSLIEFSAGLEFNFLEFDLHEPGFTSTPYLYTGIIYSMHDNFYYSLQGDIIEENTSSAFMGIPMVLGYKLRIADKIIAGAEIGVRYTFTEELDGNVPDFDASMTSSLTFGNTNSNDWYVFSGISITYTFGRKPCYCN